MRRQLGRLGSKDAGGDGISVGGRLDDKGRHALNGQLVPIDLLDELLSLVDVIVSPNALPEIGISSAIEGFGDGLKAGLANRVSAARISQEVAPASGALHRAVLRPSHRHRAGARNDDETAVGPKGGVEGDVGVVNHLDVDRGPIFSKDRAETLSKMVLLVGASGAGHTCTDGEGRHGAVSTEGLSDERCQNLGRFVQARPLRICGGPLEFDAIRIVGALGDQQRLGASSVEANSKVRYRQGSNSSVR